MTQESPTFEQLGLNAALLKAIKHIGYETPSPIQAQAIPVILERRDILGQAQTGTGKTAAFALPILQLIDPNVKTPQVLVLAPTRELAIQVAEAFQSYAAHMKGFHVLPIYGGQGYDQQIRALKRGVQVVVGTPGRVMDHMRKGTLKLDNLKHLVLDEADEMLRMGFIDDVEWVLEQTPPTRQIALFSATMPTEIAKVANTHLTNPAHIKIQVKTTTAKTIRQRYWPVSRLGKMEALTRILEVENFDAVIIFVRTKTATVEVAEKLGARGYSAEALNGDITQNIRERTIERLKGGKIDILVATDVAARGLDVDRISLVVNYDIPYDTEAYVHRIGRTGRAGREGDAILFVVRRETRMLRAIEKATGKDIEQMKLPSVADINTQRQLRFKQQIIDTLESEELDVYQTLISNLQKETALSPELIAAALAKLAQGDEPLLLDETIEPEEDFDNRRSRRDNDRGRDGDRPERKRRRRDENAEPVDMELFRMEVGKNDGVRPGNIVGAIANEADIDSQYINNIRIFEDYATVELPTGMPKELLQKLRKVWVCQKPMQLARVEGGAPAGDSKARKGGPRKEGERRDKPRGKPAGKGKPSNRNKSEKPKKPRSRD